MSTTLEDRPRVTYQDYSIERKAEVLALIQANDGNILQTSRDTGIPHQTIRRWVEYPERFSALQTEKQDNLLEKLDKRAHDLIDAMPDKIPGASLSATATALGIVIDKSQLLRGLPTSINAEVERQELVIILQSALNAGGPEPIDVTPEPAHDIP